MEQTPREQRESLYYRMIDFLRLRKRSYQFSFGQPQHNESLKDLAKFCRAGTTTYHQDEFMRGVLMGRQETFYRITAHLKLQPDELFTLYHKANNQQ